MKQIELNVNQQKLFLNKKDFIVEGSLNYLEIKVNFLTNEWKECEFILGVFTNGNKKEKQIFNDNICIVPSQVIKNGSFEVSIVGYNRSNNQVIPTNSLTIPLNYTNQKGANEMVTTHQKIENSINNAKLTNPTEITFTRNNGETFVVDFNLNGSLFIERAYYDETTKDIIIRFTNGDEINIPLDSLKDVYSGGKTDTINIEIIDNIIYAKLNDEVIANARSIVIPVKVGDNLRGKTIYFDTTKTPENIYLSDNTSFYIQMFVVENNNTLALEGAFESKPFWSEQQGWLVDSYTFPNDTDYILTKCNNVNEVVNLKIDQQEAFDKLNNEKVDKEVLDEYNERLENVEDNSKIDEIYKGIIGLEVLEQGTTFTKDNVVDTSVNSLSYYLTPVNRPTSGTEYNIVFYWDAELQSFYLETYINGELSPLGGENNEIVLSDFGYAPDLDPTGGFNVYSIREDKGNGEISKLTHNIINTQTFYNQANEQIENIEQKLKEKAQINDLNDGINYLDNKKANKEDLENLQGSIDDINNEFENRNIEVICDHRVEVTGNTGDEHGLAIQDQQMLITKIQGQTLIANNLINLTNVNTQTINGITFTVDKEKGTITANGTASESIHFIISNLILYKGHKMLLKGCPKGGEDTLGFSLYYANSSNNYSFDRGNGIVTILPDNINPNIYLYIASGNTVSNIVFKPELIDLTLMFGYGNEPTLEEYKAMELGYIQWNSRYFLNSKANLISTTQNICPRGNWIIGERYSPKTGNIQTTTNNKYKLLDCKIPVAGGIDYYFWCNELYHVWNIYFFDKDDNFLGMEVLSTSKGMQILPNTSYIKIDIYHDTGFDIDTVLTEYVLSPLVRVTENIPYESSEIIINEELWKYEYIDNLNNTKHSKLKSIDLGSLTYVIVTGESNTQHFIANATKLVSDSSFLDSDFYNDIKCLKYSTAKNNDIYCNILNKAIGIHKKGTNNQIYLNINDSEFTDVDSLKQSLQGVMLYYESTIDEVEPLEKPLADGMPVWNGGMQIQEGKVPYVLTKQYSLSLGSQVLANVQIDKEQQAQIDVLNKEVEKLEDNVKIVEKVLKPLQVGDVVLGSYLFTKDNVINPNLTSGEYRFKAKHNIDDSEYTALIYYEPSDGVFHISFLIDGDEDDSYSMEHFYLLDVFGFDNTEWELIEIAPDEAEIGIFVYKQLTAQQAYDEVVTLKDEVEVLEKNTKVVDRFPLQVGDTLPSIFGVDSLSQEGVSSYYYELGINGESIGALEYNINLGEWRLLGNVIGIDYYFDVDGLTLRPKQTMTVLSVEKPNEVDIFAEIITDKQITSQKAYDNLKESIANNSGGGIGDISQPSFIGTFIMGTASTQKPFEEVEGKLFYIEVVNSKGTMILGSATFKIIEQSCFGIILGDITQESYGIMFFMIQKDDNGNLRLYNIGTINNAALTGDGDVFLFYEL